MAFSSAFNERLKRMELDGNSRLSLLQVEKELQASKSLVLISKLDNIRIAEQRCCVLEQKIASQNFKILALKAEIDRLDSKYETEIQQLRALNSEIEELKDLEKEKDKLYDSNRSEMTEFKRNAERFSAECRTRVKELRDGLNELQSSFVKFQGNNERCNSEIGRAEVRKSQLLAAKQVLEKKLASNYRMKAHLEMELGSISHRT